MTEKPRWVRARLLASELERAAQALSREPEPTAAAIFLDRLGRLEGLERQERTEAGIGDAVEAARELRRRLSHRLSELVAEVFDLEGLEERAAALAGRPEPAEVVAWGQDALLVAGVLPWMPTRARGEVERVLETAETWVYASPGAFEPLAALAAERRALESAGRVPTAPLTGLLEAFESTRSLAGPDRRGEPASARARELLRGVLDARRKVVSLAERLRAARRVPAGPVRLAAATDAEERIAEGRWAVLVLTSAPEARLVVDYREERWVVPGRLPVLEVEGLPPLEARPVDRGSFAFADVSVPPGGRVRVLVPGVEGDEWLELARRDG